MLQKMARKLRDPRGLALGRTAVGVTMLTRPGLIPSLLGVPQQSQESMTWAVQMLGAREIALGVGALASRTDKRLWLAAGLLSDAVDAVAVSRAIRKGTVRTSAGAATVAIAVAASATGAETLLRRGTRG